MLLRFEVSNHRSVLDPVELSMVAVDEDREATRRFEGLPQSVLTVAGIYGPNASGKSNILDAINWLSYAVGTSLLGGGDHIARDSHRFGDGSELPSRFDMDLLVDGVRHGYQLEVSDTAVLYESLCSYPERRRRVLFEREGAEVDFRRGLDGTSAIRELLTPSTLVLTAAMRVGDQSIKSVGRAISGISEINARGVRKRWGSPPFDFAMRSSDSSALLEDKDSRDRLSLGPLKVGEAALKLLGLADPGIVDFDILDYEVPASGSSYHQLVFVHNVQGKHVLFSLSDESAGTRMLFSLLGPAFDALRRGQVLLLDEADASLHPRLSAQLLELFRDPQTNPNGAQLILATHDTSLLSTLNRDEVWFTEKGSDGATRLVALAEFGGDKVRRSLNLERAYLQGRFGAIPDVDHVDIRRALGFTERAL